MATNIQTTIKEGIDTQDQENLGKEIDLFCVGLATASSPITLTTTPLC